MRRLVVVALVVALSGACSGDGKQTIDRAGSSRVSTPQSVEIGAPLDSYSVTYRVEEQDGDDVRATTATLTVARPFRSRLELRDGEERVALTVADFSYLGTQPTKGDAVVHTAPPAAAPDDVRADLVAGTGTGEVRTVLDRACEVHTFAEPLLGGGGEIVPGAGVDECIDERGLILEQVVRRGSGVRERWVATAVDTSAPVREADVRLDGVRPTPAADGGGSVRRIDPASAPPGTFWQLDAAPDGFVRKGRYAVVPPQSARPDDEKTRAEVVAGVVDVFVRGHDVLIVDQGGTLGQVPPFGAHPHGTPVDLGEVAKTAEWFLTPTGAEVRALLPPGRYVKVLGTLPPDDLVAVARRLHPIEGAGITYL